MDNVFISLLENLVLKKQDSLTSTISTPTSNKNIHRCNNKKKHDKNKKKKEHNCKKTKKLSADDKLDYLEYRMKSLETIVENRTDFLSSQIKHINNFFFKKDFLPTAGTIHHNHNQYH